MSGVPHLHLTLELESPTLEADALNAVLRVRPEWKGRAHVSRCTHGITNVILKCVSEETQEVVLVRVYGRRTEKIINRESELSNLRLMQQQGLGAPLFATFVNGYVYGYFDGEACDRDQVRHPAIAPLIARRLADMHRVPVSEPAPSGSLFRTMQAWWELLPTSFADPHKQALLEQLDVPALRKEWQMLGEALQREQSPLVMCHNDLLTRNIIWDDSKGVVNFIDFEYAAVNHRGFDIGNHFCEYAGVDDPDYALYPSEEQQKAFLSEYLAAVSGCAVAEVQPAALQALYREVNKYALASHFFWGVWAVIQADNSTIDFDYLSYAHARFAEYRRRRDAFLTL